MTVSNDSAYEGVVRFPVLNESAPVDTGHIKDGLINSLESLYNGHFQQKVNMAYLPVLQVGDSSAVLGDPGYIPQANLAEDYKLVESFRFAVTLTKDGKCPPLYITVAARALGSGAQNSNIWFQYRTPEQGPVRDHGRASYAFGKVTLQGTNGTWLELEAFNQGDSGPYVLLPLFPRPKSYTVRKEPGIQDPTYPVNTVPVIVDMYVNRVSVNDYAVQFANVSIRESPWNAY